MALKASQRGSVSPFIVMDVMRRSFEREAAGKDALHLEVGQPATAAPQRVRDAAKHAIDTNKIGYTAALGLPELRAKLAAHYGSSYNVDVSPNQIVITTGSSPGFSLAFLAAFDVGDRVALAAPGYPAYKNILHALGLNAVMIETGPETRFQPTVDVLEQYFASGGDALDGLIVASPANPTGTMLDESSLRTLTEYCQERGIRL
ncbi:MAG: aminotransferase class I/II-fold pyridoxal phosphate-dependent enzyme, partial [Pseudomonadota bacterium]